MNGWVSPRLGIRFELTPDTLVIYRPDGQRFLTPVELDHLREQERQRAEEERQRAEEERQRAEEERQRAEETMAQLEQEQQRYQALMEKLRSRGIDPEQL
jgi:membrane protein involved in colicin uptake